MFADPFVTYRDVVSGAAVTDTWSRIGLTGNSATYVRNSYSGSTPKFLRTSHAIAGKGQGTRDRRLVQFQTPQLVDTVETGLMATFSVIADVPRVGITPAQTDSAYRFLVGLLRMASGNVVYDAAQANFWDKWMRGEA